MSKKLEDLLPQGHIAEWTCGHIGGAVCGECYRLLAAKAHELAMQLDNLQDKYDQLQSRQLDRRR